MDYLYELSFEVIMMGEGGGGEWSVWSYDRRGGGGVNGLCEVMTSGGGGGVNGLCEVMTEMGGGGGVNGLCEVMTEMCVCGGGNSYVKFFVWIVWSCSTGWRFGGVNEWIVCVKLYSWW